MSMPQNKTISPAKIAVVNEMKAAVCTGCCTRRFYWPFRC